MAAANLLTKITIMLFEGGALIQSLGAGVQASNLSHKIELADVAAMDAGQVEFEVQLDPIEIGMAITALTDGQSLLAQNLGRKLQDALNAKMQELGISYGDNGGSVGSPGNDAVGDDDIPSSPSSDGEPATDDSSREDATTESVE
jgi:hypothetical protein